MEADIKSVTYGGSMVRDVGALPGMLEAFVTASRRYKKKDFNKHQPAMAGAFAKTNSDVVIDDHGTKWDAGTLLHLGSDGKDYGRHVVMVHKFLPIARLYPMQSFAFLSCGSTLQFVDGKKG